MITFTVDGDPQTKGSAKAFKHRTTGRIIVQNDNAKCRAWSACVAWKAKAAMNGTGRVGPTILAVPVRVVAEFRIARPQRTKLAVPALDLDKLARALGDALTGIVYVDDKQIAEWRLTKRWCARDEAPGVAVQVEAM